MNSHSEHLDVKQSLVLCGRLHEGAGKGAENARHD